MSLPTVDPAMRPNGDVTRPDHYPRGTKVWVFCAGSWRPGIVLGSSDKAASVRYRPTEGRGTAVDTVLAHKLVSRDDDDPYVDRSISGENDADGIPRRL
jgi:hypothetical protein